jgi:hypothetical protein
VTFLDTFALSFGLLLAGLAVIAAWIFRTAAAPLAAKLALPAILVALGCLTPYEINSMLGMPRMSVLTALPDRAELIAFVARDEDKRADLWLGVGDDAPPRAYEIAIDEAMKKLLRDARGRKEHGERVMLVKRAEHAAKETGHPGVTEQRAGGSAYTIDDSAFALPNKGGGE